MQNKSIKINLYGKEIIIEMKNGKFVKPEILNQILNGTSLKPAHEPIILARKPLEGTVAQNVLEYSTGAINIEGCRIDFSENDDTRINKEYHHNALAGVSVGSHKENWSGTSVALFKNSGRWPANFIHDGSEEVLELFPYTESGKGNGNAVIGEASNNIPLRRGKLIPRHDKGSAARFFYCAKASRADRDEGLENIPAHPYSSKQQNSAGRMENGEVTNERPKQTLGRNTHPTVKPTELMRYLCRLVTPKNGTVLDPFMGSGTTGKAALLEGFDFIGIEKEDEYFQIAKARIENQTKGQE